MVRNEQNASLKQFLLFISLILCFGILLFLGLYFSQQEASKSRTEKSTLPPSKHPMFIPTSTLTQPLPSITILPNIFKIKGSGKSDIGEAFGTPVPPLYFEKTIIDPSTVQKLYFAMLALPPFPTSIKGLPASCGEGYFMHYNFGFFKDDKLIQQGTMTKTPCGGGETISLDGSYEREFNDQKNWTPFRTLLLNSLGVTAHQLYGAKDK